MTLTDKPTPASALRSRGLGRYSDRAFSALLVLAGSSVLIVLAAMVIRTLIDAWPVFEYTGFFEFLFGQDWEAGYSRTEFTGTYGAWPFIFGTLYTAVIAVVMALPLAIGVSLYINFYAPKRARTVLSYSVEILAAVPSIIFGLWGLLWFVPNVLHPVTKWVNATLGEVIPYFGGSVPNANYFHAGFVLGIMILPIITAIVREVMATTPPDEVAAAYGLGATRNEVLSRVVIPRSFGGIVGGTMLGLGRALGETIAVLMLVGGSQQWDTRLFFPGDSLASHIASTFQDASPETLTALMGIGVVLFIVTMIVNVIARLIVWRFARSASAGDAL
ncbi:phosphate ABC transporter membrane protein 1 (PhoT family) [Rhodoglobus vestalii]|uniref:Phosphate transport system permease protein n=1 Tax=Rhodoglobus vestalii TaxID=193384 RepID=A0A8H2PUL6_9MICO|nr:phosphate ABC transporter permease subunit PstC [Rhodoglobus vestalii]TQO20631.1 phosphate ABC transporter membrane protein 1 (PhoT family) [Rhodoglobus vestalii]